MQLQSCSFCFNIKSTPIRIKILNIQCAVYRLYCGAYCECKRAKVKADYWSL